jgi:pimeloyl-ACP methyl ester carboxylesterase
MQRLIAFSFFIWMLASASFAQVQQPNSISFTFVDDKYTESKPLKLEGFEYIPQKPNGKVIIFLHGGTASITNLSVVKESIKYLNTAKYAVDNGYTFVAFMRKGRGKSEGDFTEETGSCGWGTTMRQMDEIEHQVTQVIEQVNEKYGVKKIILMGHSRGGYMAAYYAAKYPDRVSAVVNLSGVFNATCENKNGGNASHIFLEDAAKKYKNQLWAYFENDSNFTKADNFNDPTYEWLSKKASENGITFQVFPSFPPRDGADTATWHPRDWATTYFPILNTMTK